MSNKNIFLFSGQGSQYPLMGSELLKLYPNAKHIYDCGSEILGFDLKKICFEADEATLAQTEYSQPAILATSLVSLFALKENSVTYNGVAGHSLGEYAAMVASGILSLEDAFTVISHRASVMSECAKNQKGAMAAILGMSADEIAEICESVDGYVVPVNYNSPAQTVIAGEESALNAACEKFTELGKKAVKLAVSAAFHSKLMQPAADEFVKLIANIKFNTPNVEFYSNVTGALLTDFADMPAYLATHLVSPVKFTDELNAIANASYQNFVEVGPNKVLTGLVKKTLKGATAMNVENEKTLTKALSTLITE